MDIFEGQNKRYCKRLTQFGRNIVLRMKPRAAIFVVRFANFKSRALSHDPSRDCVIARAKGRVRAQASYGNITVLSHLKVASNFSNFFCSLFLPSNFSNLEISIFFNLSKNYSAEFFLIFPVFSSKCTKKIFIKKVVFFFLVFKIYAIDGKKWVRFVAMQQSTATLIYDLKTMKGTTESYLKKIAQSFHTVQFQA